MVAVRISVDDDKDCEAILDVLNRVVALTQAATQVLEDKAPAASELRRARGESAMANEKKPAYPVHLDRNHLPEPEWKFPNAKIEMYATESTPDFPPNKQAPKGSPNILLVLLDDVGFGWMSVTGGLVRSPTAERLFKRGLLFNQFHTTALCSPTRAAMLTGPQSSLGRNRRHPGDGDRLSGLLRHHSQGLRDVRRASETVGLRLRVVRQEPQCAR